MEAMDEGERTEFIAYLKDLSAKQLAKTGITVNMMLLTSMPRDDKAPLLQCWIILSLHIKLGLTTNLFHQIFEFMNRLEQDQPYILGTRRKIAQAETNVANAYQANRKATGSIGDYGYHASYSNSDVNYRSQYQHYTGTSQRGTASNGRRGKESRATCSD